MNKQQRAYTVMRERILDGRYGPGYRLVIDELAEELSVSTVPVREAIRRLEAEGWVVYRPNVGAHVAPVDPARWEQVMGVMAVLEGAATAMAAGGLEVADFHELEDVNAEMGKALDRYDVMGFSRLNRAFHFAIYRRCPNAYLVQLLEETWDRLDQLRQTVFTYIPSRGRASMDEHLHLVRLLERPAPTAEIEGYARRHKLRTIEAYRTAQRAEAPQGNPRGAS